MTLVFTLSLAGLAATGATALPSLDTRRIDAAFAPFAKPGSPGCAVGVVQDGRLRFKKGYGEASLEHAVPITPMTVFDLGSTSKQITAAAVVLLEIDGRLSLDDDIRKHLPDMPDYGTPITLRHLLTHTSGLRDYTDLLWMAGRRVEDVATSAEALAILTRQRGLNFRPGTEHRYCNSGFFLASVLVERLSGRSLREFARVRLFEPLGMSRTQYLDDHTLVVPRRATGYEPREGGGFRVAMSDWEQVGDGSVQASIEDLARWAANFDTATVGGKTLIDRLTEAGRLEDGTPLHYGLGLGLDSHRGLALQQHAGAWGGYRAALWRFPAKRLEVMTLCNTSAADASMLTLQTADAALDTLGVARGATAADRAAAGATATPAAPARFAGVYVNEHLGEVARFVGTGGPLRLEGLGPAVDLDAAGGTRFATRPGDSRVGTDDDQVAVEFAPDGSEVVITSWRIGPHPATFVRAAAAAARSGKDHAAPGVASDAAGSYGSPELGAVWTAFTREGALHLQPPNGDPSRLDPLLPDLYESDFGLVRLLRDPSGKAEGFAVTNRGLVRFTLRRVTRVGSEGGV